MFVLKIHKRHRKKKAQKPSTVIKRPDHVQITSQLELGDTYSGLISQKPHSLFILISHKDLLSLSFVHTEDDSCPDLVFDAWKIILLCIDVYLYKNHLKQCVSNIYMKGKYMGDDGLLLPKATCGAWNILSSCTCRMLLTLTQSCQNVL